jgi:hypothetical protein
MSNTPPKTIFKTMLYFDAPKYVWRHGQGHETLFFSQRYNNNNNNNNNIT